MARVDEGMVPGDVEYAPVPLAAPAAIPTLLPINRTAIDAEVRCDGRRMLRGLMANCGKKLAERGPFIGTCPRCGKQYEAAA